MSEYQTAAGPEFEMLEHPMSLPEPDDAERLRRADLFLRLPSLFSPDQPIEEIVTTIAGTIVEHTSAVSAAINLVRPSDLATIALGYSNLPAGYLEAMQQARQNSIQGEWLRVRAKEDRTWVLRQAPEYMLARPEYAHMADLIRELPFDTLIGTPFLNRPDLMGFVFLYYAKDAPVDDGEIAFARDLARYAGPLMENAWLFQETRKRANELEALARADHALHESILLENVYQAMLDLAVGLLGADRSMFLAFDEAGRFHAAGARGVPESELAALQEVYHQIDRSRFAGRGRELSISEDTQNDPRVNPGVRKTTTSASSVDIPVFVHGEFFGNFVLGYYKRRTFSDDDKRLFMTLSGRAGLALENAVLFRESQRRTSELEALYRADEALHQSLELDSVLEAMANLATDLLGADSSLVVGFDDSDRLGIRASKNLNHIQRESVHKLYQRFDREHFRKMPRPLRAALVEDSEQDPNLREADGFRAPGSFAEIPVLVGDEVWGIFGIGWAKPRTFSDDDRRMFDAFASRAGLAIQNASLFDRTRRRTNELEALSKVDQALHESIVLEDVYQAMIDLAVDLFGADRSLFLTFDDAGVFHAAVTRGVPEEQLAGLQPIYRAMPRSTFQDRRPEIVITWKISRLSHA